MWDRRLPRAQGSTLDEDIHGDYATQNAYLFTATYIDGMTVEIQVNPEFDETEAAQRANKYARVAGQMPTFLRTDLKTIAIHRGREKAGGSNQGILIHADRADTMEKGGFLEEMMYHEGAHNSLDDDVKPDRKWLRAQVADGNFISTYAAEFPDREDVASSFLAWVVVRHRRGRVHPLALELIEETMPNRLKYFDEMLEGKRH